MVYRYSLVVNSKGLLNWLWSTGTVLFLFLNVNPLFLIKFLKNSFVCMDFIYVYMWTIIVLFGLGHIEARRF